MTHATHHTTPADPPPPPAGLDLGAPLVMYALDTYESPLIRYAARLLGDLETARDVVQDTFFRLCRQTPGKRAELVGPPPRIGPWLYTVCRNRAFDLHRKQQNQHQTASPRSLDDAPTPTDPNPGPDATAQTRDDTRQLLALVDQLPDNQRDVVTLRFQAGHSYKQIADITGHSVGHVGYLLHHALKSLRQQLTPPPTPPPTPPHVSPGNPNTSSRLDESPGNPEPLTRSHESPTTTPTSPTNPTNPQQTA